MVIMAAAAALAVSLAVGCQESLAIKEYIQKKVAELSSEWHGIKTVVAGQCYAAKVACNGDIVYVLYYDSATQRLMIVKSPDRGSTWNNPFIVDSTPAYYTSSNNIAVDASNLYISYYEDNTVHFIQLTDTGATFSASNARTVSDAYSAYPYGYENALAYDAQYVYVAYCAGGCPSFRYAEKSSAMSFSAPVCIDSALNPPEGSFGNRKPLSMIVNSDGINVAYFDDYYNSHEGRLKCAVFSIGDSLPKTVSTPALGLVPGSPYITPAYRPSAASRDFISFYDNDEDSLKLYEHYTYPDGMMLMHRYNVITIDSSSSDVGEISSLMLLGETLYVAYYDDANSAVKFGIGNQASASVDYAFENAVVDTVGGSQFDLSLAADQSSDTFYLVYYDSSGGGALKLAKSLDGGDTW